MKERIISLEVYCEVSVLLQQEKENRSMLHVKIPSALRVPVTINELIIIAPRIPYHTIYLPASCHLRISISSVSYALQISLYIDVNFCFIGKQDSKKYVCILIQFADCPFT